MKVLLSVSLMRAYGTLMRPHQWLKNLMLFFPPFLGGTLLRPMMLRPGVLIPFAAFCLASSATYVLNDILDSTNDSNHPVKSRRPIPSGAVSAPIAAGTCGALAGMAIVLAWSVSPAFLVYLLAYLAVSSAYSIRLKDLPIIDIFCISAGFVLRLMAGGAAFGVRVSEWLFLSVFLLSLFLSTGKRLSEKQELGEGAGQHRKVLDGYPDGFLEKVMLMTGSSVLVTYSMYVISRHSELLLYSIPLCCFGLFRYVLRIARGGGGDPTESLLRDIPLCITGLVWAVLVGWGIYG